MKVLTLMNGKEFILEEDIAQELSDVLMGPDTMIKLPTGEMVNKSSFSSLTNPEVIATWWGYPLDKGGRSFMRDGERCFLEPHNFSQIEYKLHPKYGLGELPMPNPNETLSSGEETVGIKGLLQ